MDQKEESNSFCITVKSLTGDEHQLECLPEETIDLVKDKIQECMGHPPRAQTLVLKRKPLADGSSTLKDLEIGDGVVLTLLIDLTVKVAVADSFDASRCEIGNDIASEGKSLTKTGGFDLTSTFATNIVSTGVHVWNVKVTALGTTNNSNLMIGVAHPDVPLDFPTQVWRRGAEPTDHAGKLAFVKSPGNTTGRWENSVSVFGAEDVITVKADMDSGVVSFKKNGNDVEDMPPCSCMQSPLSLWINMDYNGDAVEIVDE